MAALIFMFMPTFFGGVLEAFAWGFSPCILCSNDKKMPYGAALADKLSKRSSLSVKAVLSPKALCKRKANLILYQHSQHINFQIHSGQSLQIIWSTANRALISNKQAQAISAGLSRKQHWTVTLSPRIISSHLVETLFLTCWLLKMKQKTLCTYSCNRQ